jgi:prepilin-type N-terminal cleavage/methylation domain-containing protein
MSLPQRNSARKAVTAIELLVVIAIVGILIGLLVGGVMMISGREQNATTLIDLSEFRAALERFKAKYGVYPPSQITISKTTVDPQLQRIWPNIKQDAFAKWPGMPAGNVTLKGDQCLVLFLGGYHDGTSCYGLSSSKTYPFTAPSPKDTDREAPLFKFKGDRLYQRTPGNPFYSYGDGFFQGPATGSPKLTCYAYFCPLSVGGYQAAATHCSTMTDAKGVTPQPYKNAAGAYLNPDSYQIISPGNDGLWGAATQWTQGQVMSDPASNDNLTNFAGGVLSGG